MKIIEMRVEVTINKGNYENEKIGTTCIVEDGDKDLIALREELLALCYGRSPIDKNPKKEVKEKAEVVEAIDVEKEEVEEVIEEKPLKKKTKLKIKLTPYDRSLEIHKKIFSSLMTELFGDWKSMATTAKTSSMFLDKEDFLDESGEVVQSFKDKLKKTIETAK